MQTGKPKSMTEKLDEMNIACSAIGNIGSWFALPFVRREFGPEGLGIQGGIAMLVLILIAAATALIPFYEFFGVWMFFVFMRRLETLRLLRRGWHPHSSFQGRPYLAMKFVKNWEKALWFEPFLVMLIGMALVGWSVEVGGLFMFSGFCLLGTHMAREHALNVAVQRRHDAEIEATEVEHRFKTRFNRK